MRTRLLTLLCVMGLAGCPIEVIEPDGGRSSSDGSKCPAPPDLTPLAAPCAAAKGLGGDILRCIDFSAIADGPITNPPPAQLTGWDFASVGGNCWEIANGKLQVRNFSSFASSCGFLMPAVSATDYNKYNRFTLAVIQTVDLNDQQQRAQILLGLDDPGTRLLKQETGKQPRQRNLYEVTRTALPNGGTNSYQPLFKITSGVGVGGTAQGWQIESIAISGSQDP